MVSKTTKAAFGTAFDVFIIFGASFTLSVAGTGTAYGVGATDNQPDPIGSVFVALFFSLAKVFLYLAKIRGIDSEL